MLLESLAYLRTAVAGGEIWRLATATFAHLSIGHLALNAAGLAVVVAALRRVTDGRAMAAAFAVAALATTVGVHLASTLDWYAGASSATLGLLAWGATRLRLPIAAALVAVLVVGAVVDLERTTSLLGEPLAPAAHGFGIAGGLGWALLGAVVARARRARSGRHGMQRRSSAD